MSLRLVLVCIAILVACGACGASPDGSQGSPDAGDDTPDASTSSDPDAAAPDATPDAPSCDTGQQYCAGGCVDTTTSNDHCGSCNNACDSGSTCAAGTCKPGQPIAATGTCTYIDQPGWLSCPTGMSCRCYYYYHKVFENQPASLSTWLSDSSLDVLGGMIPSNSTMSGVSPVMIPLAATTTGKTGGVYPYTVNVSMTNVVQIQIRATSGYVPAKFILQTSADCGNQGKRLECNFTH